MVNGARTARGTVILFHLPLVVWMTTACIQSQEVLTRTTNGLSDAGSNQPQDAEAARTHDARSNQSNPTTTPPLFTEQDPDDRWRDARAPLPPLDDDHEVIVGTGYRSTCASVSGRLYCWGDNSYGQLGTPPDRPLERPRHVQVDFVAAFIDGGERHMCARSTASSVYCWGANDAGQLGQGDRQARYEPTRVALPESVRALSCGESHAFAIGESGQLYGWGWNKEGQLAIGEDANDNEQRGSDVLEPTLIDTGVWLNISAGQGHTCGTKADGSVWCWGRNFNRQVGQYDGERFRTPQRVGSDNDWKLVVAGQTHSCALRTDHSLWCWGSNLEGASYPLGEEWSGAEDDPEYVSGVEWRTLDTRWMSSCGLTLNNEALCWGRNEEGQLGLNDWDKRDSPAFVARGGLQLSTGLLHTCGVSEGLEVYCTGDNEVGQLGSGDFERRNQFTRVRF